MKSPYTGKDMLIHKERRAMSFRKEEFAIVFHAYRCEDSGELFEDDHFAKLNYNQLVNQYRESHSIPFPEQIIAIREKYSVSAAKMSEILGFGINGYRNYENGEVPSISNARLIQSVEDPEEFKKMVILSGAVEPAARKKLLAHLDKLIAERQQNWFVRNLECYYLGDNKATSITGFKCPDMEKFGQMVVFFSEKLKPFKTKLNKLLFYADFMMFSKTGYSISGAQYIAINMGPVPHNFNGLYEYFCKNSLVDIQYITFREGAVGEKFLPNPDKAFDRSIFSDSELEVLEKIAKRFETTSTNDIINLSHLEMGWIENEKEKRVIDYRYGFDLRGFDV